MCDICNHHYQLFLILFIVFNDDFIIFIIEIMIVLCCIYVNTLSASRRSRNANIDLEMQTLFFRIIFLDGFMITNK